VTWLDTAIGAGVVAAVYVVFLRQAPYRTCRWCGGEHGAMCWSCQGRRRVLRRGARTVARLTRSGKV
jgi:DnaJ-class molecular chaperone